MRCPIDGSELNITDRQGIEIDYCPQCRGVWLDRGELDKIIERTGESFGARPAEPEPRRTEEPRDQGSYQREPEYRPQQSQQTPQSQEQYKKKKKGSFLEDLFDFG